MSHLEEFLAFVLPWDGEEAHTWKSVWENTEKPGKDGRPIFAGYADNTIGGLANKARVIDTRWQHDVYIGLGSQSESLDPGPGKKWRKSLRRGYNISAHQCLFADIDVGKANAYATQYEAVQDLLEFCARIKFPLPSLLMDSGSGGLHAYWRFLRWVKAAEWQPMANALATLLSRNIKCDSGVTKDVARILRPPETHNYKHRDKGIITQVRMGQPGQSYPVEQIRAALKVPHLYVASVTEKPRSGLNAALAEMPASPAIALDVVADAGCGVFKEAILTGGKDNDYPLWFLLLCAARFDPDPHGAAHMVSEEHDDYSFTETQQKIESLEAERKARDVGWPACREFDRLSPHCKVCPHLKEDKTPFHLVWPPPKPDTADPEGSPGLPPHFMYGDDGYLRGYSLINKIQMMTTILSRHVYDGALDDKGDLVFKVDDDVGGASRFVCVPQGAMAAEADCMRVLFEQGLVIEDEHRRPMRRFVMAFSEMLRKNLTARIKAQPFGWTEDDGFCYGGRVITPTGEEPAYQRESQRLLPYAPKGSLDAWKKTTKYVTEHGRPELEIIMATAFAAPLLKMSLSQAVLLSAYSSESGAGKSTAMKIGQAVWGHPITGVNGLDDTENAIIAKVGDLRHLPLYWDEMKTKDQYNRIINVTFQLGQGKNKARLDRESKAREVTSFATMMTACANDSLFNIVVNGTKGTRAGAYRVFEVIVPPMGEQLSVTDVSADVADLDKNYGRAGEVYAKFLGQKGAQIQQDVRNVQRHLEQDLGTAPNERFWLATMSALLTGATYARQLGLANFHVPEMWKVLTSTFHKLRDRLSTEVQEMQTAVDGEEFLDGLISSLFNKQLVITTRIHNGTKPKMDIKLAAGDATHLSNVWAQIGVQENVLRVKAGPFRDYIGKSGWNYTEVKHVLTNHFGMRLEFATVGAGVPIFGGAFDRTQSRCYDIDLPPSVVTSLPSSPSANSGSP